MPEGVEMYCRAGWALGRGVHRALSNTSTTVSRFVPPLKAFGRAESDSPDIPDPSGEQTAVDGSDREAGRNDDKVLRPT